MPRIAYVNGQYVPHAHASVHVEDRGYQFADGVYEVCAVLGGRLLDLEGHMARLERSLRELSIAEPMSRGALLVIMRQMLARNKVRDGLIYIQVTRGVAARDHRFPMDDVAPALVVTAKSFNWAAMEARAEKGINVHSEPDNRWDRCDIKTVSLIANVLAKQKAAEQGAGEAWLVDDEGYVTEGAASTAWIVTGDGTLVTRPLSNNILPGITRATLFEVAAAKGVKIEERAFTIEEAKQAREAFITAATAFVQPVVMIDDQPLGNGVPGAFTLDLRAAYIENARAVAKAF